MQQVTITGATGSIGLSTLDVISRHPESFQVFALTANSNVQKLVELAEKFRPRYLVTASDEFYPDLKALTDALDWPCEALSGTSALCQVCEAPEVDIVMAAIVGAAGLQSTMAAANAGKKILLANKESLVMSGQLFIDAVNKSGATLLPVDSEHNAIFQCLPEHYQYGDPAKSGIEKILLTGSGGPFRTRDIGSLHSVTPDEACAHPNWSMGRKISVDSATMMNKGLEFTEACWLFGLRPDQIQVVIHPQSVIHSMVQYRDGSVLAQMGNPDMRTPIAHALSYPDRIESGVVPLDFSAMTDFSFTLPDFKRYPNLQLAIDCMAEGQGASTALNASNEISVEAFLAGKISFTDISRINQQVTHHVGSVNIKTLEDVMELDKQARCYAQEKVGHH